MPTKRSCLSRIVVLPLFVFIVSVLVEESNQHILPSSPVESLCLRRCLLRAVKRSKIKVSMLSWYRNCINRNNPDQEAKRRFRKATLSAIPECGVSSSEQSVDWTPSVVNVTFGQYENTSYWYVNVSWTPLNESYGNWTNIMVKFVVLSPKSDLTAGIPATCSVHPKNVTFQHINISSYHYEYPRAILLKVVALPYSRNEDNAEITRYEPPTLTPPLTKVNTTVTPPPTKVNTTDPPPPEPLKSGPVRVDNRSNRYTQRTHTSGNPLLKTVVFSSVAGVFVLLLIIPLLVLHCRRKLSLSLNEEAATPTRYKYHAFIIYSSDDSDFVNRVLIPTLERYNFKYCVHWKDFPVGEVFARTIVKSVYNSFKIIAVVSEHFATSNACKFELDHAQRRLLTQGDDCLIVIKYDDVDVTEVLGAPLLERSYIDYTSIWDRSRWESKLVQVLQEGVLEDESDDCREGNANNNILT